MQFFFLEKKNLNNSYNEELFNILNIYNIEVLYHFKTIHIEICDGWC